MKYLIEKYNRQRNIIFISPYPEKNVRYSAKVCALGGFTKNISDALKSQSRIKNRRYIVITTIINRKKTEIYEERNNLIYRVFQRNKIFSYFNLFYAISKFSQIKTLIIQFEFASLGNSLISVLFPLVLLYSKLLGKEIILVIHQVVTNLKEINGHLGWKQHNWKSLFFNFGLKLFYKLMVNLSDKIVVLEKEFKDRLIKIIKNKNKIYVIPHGVDTKLKRIPKNLARKKLGLPKNKFILLYFGYLTWYKGADLFLKMAEKNKNPQFYFVIAGGPSFTQKNKPHYQKFLQVFKNPPQNTLITGFVKEREIPLYFSAADLVALPYRSMISSSGPLSLTFSFEKPVLLSKNLLPYKKSKDFIEAFKQANLKDKDIFFSIKKKGGVKKISRDSLNKLIYFSKIMKKQRSYVSIAPKYLSLICSSQKNYN